VRRESWRDPGRGLGEGGRGRHSKRQGQRRTCLRPMQPTLFRSCFATREHGYVALGFEFGLDRTSLVRDPSACGGDGRTDSRRGGAATLGWVSHRTGYFGSITFEGSIGFLAFVGQS
jgi:hypothetical protein